MPGIVLTTSVVTGPTTVTVSPTSTFFVAGVTTRGPEGEAFLVSSLAEFEDVYGGYTADGYVHQTLQTFFEEGGSRAYVSRVIGSGAAAAECELVDASDDVCLVLTASGEGTWANTLLNAEVSQRTLGETFRIRITLDGDLVYSSPAFSSIADAVEEINNSSVASLYVTAAAGASTLIPAVDATNAFSGGVAGSAPLVANYVSALDAFIKTLGAGSVAIPGQEGTTIWEGIMAHCAENNRIGLLGFDKEDEVSDAIDGAESVSNSTGAEFCGFFYPWVKIERNGITTSIPCEGYVAGKRAKAHNNVGPYQAYAGASTNGDFVKGTYVSLTASEANELNDGFVNPIRVINGDVRIYGARSASSDVDNYRFITAKEVVNYVVSQAEANLESLVFSIIDGRGTLFGKVSAALVNILDPLAQAGALYPLYAENGRLLDPGYKVTVNEQLNPVTQLATGTVKARVGMRVSSLGDTIEVEISKSNLTASLA